MKTFRLFWVLVIVAIIFAVSTYFASKRLKDLKSEKTEKLVVVDAPSPEPTVAVRSTPVEKISGGPKQIPGCKIDPDFKDLKLELGKIVNVRELREKNVSEFLKQINAFKLKNGLPLPIAVDSAKLSKEGIVFNNCRSTCRGSVHEIFVSRIVRGRFIEVLTKGGVFKKLPLHDSGLEVASVDELSKKGVPFRSWLAPVSDSDWYINGSDLLYSLDIEGLWLKIDAHSKWEVVVQPKALSKLHTVDEPLKIPGCNIEEQCLEGGLRHFKAPILCRL